MATRICKDFRASPSQLSQSTSINQINQSIKVTFVTPNQISRSNKVTFVTSTRKSTLYQPKQINTISTSVNRHQSVQTSWKVFSLKFSSWKIESGKMCSFIWVKAFVAGLKPHLKNLSRYSQVIKAVVQWAGKAHLRGPIGYVQSGKRAGKA